MLLDFDVKRRLENGKEVVGNHIYSCEVHSLTDMERKQMKVPSPALSN